MIERRDGAIINIATIARSITGEPNRPAYSIYKAAVIGLTKPRADFTSSNIRVSALPGNGCIASPARLVGGHR